jgi:hypothetical protein
MATTRKQKTHTIPIFSDAMGRRVGYEHDHLARLLVPAYVERLG